MNSAFPRSCSVLNSCGDFGGGSQRGVALVLTLIMLAVITIIAVLFLATARRNRSSTVVRIDQTTAEFAAESAYNHAVGKIAERIINDRNLLSFDFFVSRPLGYGYQLDNNGAVIRPFESNTIPRVLNNSNTVDVYLDLNRTRYFDDPGNPTNRPFGDPIWEGILDRPWFPHSRTNRFVARAAYMVLPVGKALDANNIHHDTAPAGSNPFHGYMRNQGFGPWELNLAAFLHEFNPGFWDYSYTSVSGRPNTAGRAFEDALSIVRYREGWPADALSVPTVQTFADVYLDAPFNNFPQGSIDVYSDGNLGYPLGVDISLPDDDTPLKTFRWPGADTTNHFFHHQEFFDHADVGGFFGRSNKVTYGFYLGLSNTLAGVNVHGQPNGPAFYRMMAQLGTQTGSDFESRINLNFADEHANLPGTNFSATNFVAWDASPELAVAFFTNVAQRIFLAQSNEFNPLGTNQLVLRSMLEIPVYPTNRYSSAVHRILQTAANIFDATRSNIYPSVFRPIFGTDASGRTTFIVGYTNDDRLSTLQTWLDNNTNGIPLVVGAKKGFPNFNEFTLRSDILVTRKLQLTRPSTVQGTRPDGTNQMYVLGISNYFGAESWNSYDVARFGPYPRPVRIVVTNFTRASLTNSLGLQTNSVHSAIAVTNITNWRGGVDAAERLNAFRLTLNTNQVFLSNAVYIFSGPNANTFANISTNSFEDLNNTFPVPDWVLTLSNRLAYWMFEPGLDRIIDFVLLEDSHVVDLHRDLVAGRDPYNLSGITPSLATLWRTNRLTPNGPTDGIKRQIDISLGIVGTGAAEWRDFAMAATPREQDKQAAINGFLNFCGFSPLYPGVTFTTNSSLAMQTPFNPAAKLAALSTWQANDPLVHYHPEDLRMGIVTNHQYLTPKQPAQNVAPSTLTNLNTRYFPWIGNRNSTGARYPYGETPITELAVKDPGVDGSVDWSFPSFKLATAGLLGRVHRGTPWQSIYFKSEIASQNEWAEQSPDRVFIPGRGVISRAHPTNDWLLLDMFTTGLDERTSRGLVSINQTNMESWSALFGGIVVLSNNVPGIFMGEPKRYEELYVRPSGGLTNGFYQIWTNIYEYQLAKGRPLESIGELIRNVPELTTLSPFLNLDPNVAQSPQMRFGLDDFAYEQIPQQILSLLRVGQSRFVVYAYGQALKPERINPATGLVENYQVTAEFATRTVLRIEGDPRDRVRAVVESFNILPPD